MARDSLIKLTASFNHLNASLRQAISALERLRGALSGPPPLSSRSGVREVHDPGNAAALEARAAVFLQAAATMKARKLMRRAA